MGYILTSWDQGRVCVGRVLCILFIQVSIALTDYILARRVPKNRMAIMVPRAHSRNLLEQKCVLFEYHKEKHLRGSIRTTIRHLAIILTNKDRLLVLHVTKYVFTINVLKILLKYTIVQ